MLLHVAVDCSFLHTNYSWRQPDTWTAHSYYSVDWYESLARLAEAGRIDMLFFGDAAETPENHGGDFAAAIEDGVRWPKHDNMPLVALMSRVTSHLGFGVTMSTSYHHPFHVARLFASMDHLTGGRIAWNAVTSAYKNEAANFGFASMVAPELRYARAHEHVEVVRKLWGSVEPGAIVFDQERGIFGDPSKVHRIDHAGEHYAVRGPLPTMPTVDGDPIVITAGQSADGMAFAAVRADVQFASRRNLASMRAHRVDLDERLAMENREARDVGVLWSVKTQYGTDRNDADARARRALEQLPPRAGLMQLSAKFGVDFSKVAEDRPIGDLVEEVREQRVHFGQFVEIASVVDPATTVAEYGRRFLYHPDDTVSGNGAQIAEQLIEIHEFTGSNGGIILSPTIASGQLSAFVAHVVPELQRRGAMRVEYAGTTLRSNLSQ
jgi:FMN-dependent oxidoreductase (nitrilotriacetate monooxygenase family)